MMKWIAIGSVVVAVLAMMIIVPVALGLAFTHVGSDCTTSSESSTSAGTGPNVGKAKGKLITNNTHGNQPLGGGTEKEMKKFIPIYQGAAAKFKLGDQGPSMLAGVHYEETKFGDTGSNDNGGPYVGPTAWGTQYWDDFAIDGDGDGKRDIFNVADAIYTTANRLKQAGAPKDWNKALIAYNPSQTYATKVIEDARRFNIPAKTSVTSDRSLVWLGSFAKAAGGKDYLIGDSIGVGLEPELSGFTVNATGSITLHDSLPKIEGDREKIKNAGNVVIELGTNKSNGFEQEAKSMVNKVRAINGNATIYWVQIFSEGDYAAENKTISQLDGVTIIQTRDKNIPLADGIHPNPAGYKKLAGVIEDAVKNGGGTGTGSSSTSGSGSCESGSGGGSTSGGTVSGNVQELTKQIYDKLQHGDNITQPYKSSSGDTVKLLKDVASGKKYYTTCSNAPGGGVDINPNILKFVLEASEKTTVAINAITDKCHSNGSPHYSGEAIDLDLNGGPLGTLEPIARKYGGTKNSETSHHHFDFPK